MKLTKILLGALVALVLSFVLIKPIFAQENDVTIHFFWARGCPHCAKEKVFLTSLAQKYPQLQIKDYEITENRDNLRFLEKVGKELSADVSGVPFTVIGKQHFSGYYTDETTGKEIEDEVKCAVENGCEDIVETITKESVESAQESQTQTIPESIKLPLLGDVRIKNLSLPVFTFVIALLDGFNPCAMWTLLFLISLLLGMKDRVKMWTLGIAFIASSALVYFLFLSAWLNFFLFLGFVIWVRIAIGLVALTAGGYNLRDYFTNKTGGCEVMGDKKRQKVFERIKNITQNKKFFLALAGIILLAFAVNLVELICSAGLPAIYTQVLSLSKLPTWQYYLYLIFYILIFMLDDLIVFFAAMTTLQAVGIESKYSRYSHLIGGIVMLIIGLLMLFKPELLMFG